MKKGICCLVLTLVFALLLSTASAETITLKIAHNYDFTTIPESVIAAGERLNAKYAAEGKDLTIEFETDYQRIDWAEYTNNLIFAYKNGDCADIFSVSDVPTMQSVGMLLDISEMMTSDFVDNVWTSYMVDGKAYGMPFDLPVRVIYFNKTSLQKMGWNAEDIDALPAKAASGEFTWEQFIDLCKEVKDSGTCEWGLAHRPGAGSDFLDVLRVLGGKYYDDNGTLVFDTEGLTRFFQSIYDNANTLEITPHDLNQRGWTEINTMVGDGTCFAYYGPMYSSTYVANAVSKTPEQFAEDVAFMVFPVSQYSEKSFVVAAPQGMAISAATKYPEVCKDLLKELYTESYDLLADHASTIFTLSSVKAANDLDVMKSNPILTKVGYMADYAISTPSVGAETAFNQQLITEIVQLELGQITAEQAVEEMRVQLELNLDEGEIIFE